MTYIEIPPSSEVPTSERGEEMVLKAAADSLYHSLKAGGSLLIPDKGKNAKHHIYCAARDCVHAYESAKAPTPKQGDALGYKKTTNVMRDALKEILTYSVYADDAVDFRIEVARKTLEHVERIIDEIEVDTPPAPKQGDVPDEVIEAIADALRDMLYHYAADNASSAAYRAAGVK